MRGKGRHPSAHESLPRAYVLELATCFDMALILHSPHRNLVLPNPPRLRRVEVGYLRPDVSGRNRVCPCKADPFYGKAPAWSFPTCQQAEISRKELCRVRTQMHHGRLARVVCRLQLGHIDDVGAHARCSYEASLPEAWYVALLLLPPPHLTGGPRTPYGSVQVSSHDIRVERLNARPARACARGSRLRGRHVKHRAPHPCYARVGHEDVQAPAKIGEYSSDAGPDGGEGGRDVDLVCLTCFCMLAACYICGLAGPRMPSKQLTLDSPLSCDLLCTLRSRRLVLLVPDGHIRSGLGQRVAGGQADATAAACHNGDTALEGKKGEDGSFRRRRRGVMGEVPGPCEGRHAWPTSWMVFLDGLSRVGSSNMIENRAPGAGALYIQLQRLLR